MPDSLGSAYRDFTGGPAGRVRVMPDSLGSAYRLYWRAGGQGSE